MTRLEVDDVPYWMKDGTFLRIESTGETVRINRVMSRTTLDVHRCGRWYFRWMWLCAWLRNHTLGLVRRERVFVDSWERD